jgi:microcystin degradation protein MlrC
MFQTFGPSKNPMGTGVWVSAPNDLDLVLMSIRTQTFHPDAFEQLGLDLSKKKLVIVKSSNHFYAGFQPIAKEIFWIMSEGAIAPTFADIPYTKLEKPYWPKVADPFAA